MTAPSNLFRLLLCLAAAVANPLSVLAEGNPSYAEEPIVVEYDVIPSWPNRPDDVSPFGWVSGIAIDGEKQVWIFNRGPDPVQVYTTEGKFVRTWGKDRFKDAHQLRVGPEGNIWVADFGLHIVQKYTPEGELLLTLGVRGERAKTNRISTCRPTWRSPRKATFLSPMATATGGSFISTRTETLSKPGASTDRHQANLFCPMRSWSTRRGFCMLQTGIVGGFRFSIRKANF